MSRDSAVSIATSYWLDDWGVKFESQWGQEFSLPHGIQTGSGVHSTSCPMCMGALSPGVKRLARETDHSPPTSAEVKKTWVYTSTPLYASWRSAYLVKYRDKLYFTFTLQKPSQIYLNIYQICEPVPQTLFISIFGRRTLNKRNL
jgi:hypothetical protein